MKRGIAAVLDPLAILPGVKIRNSQRAMERPVWSVRLDIRYEAHKGGIAFEDHVELAHLVALHAVRTLRIDVVPFHVTIDAFDHGARALQVAKPVLGVRRPQRRSILFDKGLEDAVDVRADSLAISRAVVLGAH